jgi:WXXGXW repeat (2 copies)
MKHGLNRTFLALAAASLSLAALSGCVAYALAPRPVVVGEVVAPLAPPPPRVEVVPPPPRPVETVEWRPGHWHWDGRAYVWIPGGYVERPHRAARWEPGHWVERPRGWVWLPGGWR